MIKKDFFKENILFNIILGIIIFLGLFLRIKGYLSNSSLWHDECALAWNVKFKSFSGLFSILKYDQMAPPLFLVFTKILTKIFGYSEYVFRFIPFIFGCASIPLFYLLSKKVLTNKFNLLLTTALFAVNTGFLNYSFEFKPYIIDAFLTMAIFLFFINLDISKISLKKCWGLGLLFMLLPWFSFVSVFSIASGFLFLIFKNFKSELKKKAILIVPITFSCLAYLKLFILNSYMHSHYLLYFWQNNFTDRGVKLFIFLLAKNLDYFFNPVKDILFCLILFFAGIFLLIKEKSKFGYLSITTIILVIIASSFHIYPFAERLILFLAPIFLIYMLKPLDLISGKRIFLSAVLILMFASSFYPQIGKTIQFLKAEKFDKNEYPREMMAYMVKNLKPTDIIYINTSSDADFAYYSSFYKIKNITIQEKVKPTITKQEYFTILNSLKSGDYWFFIPIDYIKTPVADWIEEWIKNKKIMYYYKINEKYKSLLLYVQVK